MKKLFYSILFMFIIVSPLIQAEYNSSDYNVLNACPTDTSFIKRLVSTCRLSEGECNDGEWLILDRDCKLDETIFYQMWFIRILLLVSLVLFVKKNKYFPISVLFLIALFFINGALY